MFDNVLCTLNVVKHKFDYILYDDVLLCRRKLSSNWHVAIIVAQSFVRSTVSSKTSIGIKQSLNLIQSLSFIALSAPGD